MLRKTTAIDHERQRHGFSAGAVVCGKAGRFHPSLHCFVRNKGFRIRTVFNAARCKLKKKSGHQLKNRSNFAGQERFPPVYDIYQVEG